MPRDYPKTLFTLLPVEIWHLALEFVSSLFVPGYGDTENWFASTHRAPRGPRPFIDASMAEEAFHYVAA